MGNLCTLWCVAAAVLAAGPTQQQAAPPDDSELKPMIDRDQPVEPIDEPFVLAPSHIDLGAALPGESVEAMVWLINGGDREVTFVKAIADCGCLVAKDFESAVVGPGEVIPIRIRMDAADTHGIVQKKNLTAVFRAHPPVKMSVQLAARDRHFFEHRADELPDLTPDLILLPDVIEHTPSRSHQVFEHRVLLLNTSNAPLHITTIESDLRYIISPDFKPVLLEPGETVRYQVKVRSPRDSQAAMELPLRFTTEAGVEVGLVVRFNSHDSGRNRENQRTSRR